MTKYQRADYFKPSVREHGFSDSIVENEGYVDVSDRVRMMMTGQYIDLTPAEEYYDFEVPLSNPSVGLSTKDLDDFYEKNTPSDTFIRSVSDGYNIVETLEDVVDYRANQTYTQVREKSKDGAALHKQAPSEPLERAPVNKSEDID